MTARTQIERLDMPDTREQDSSTHSVYRVGGIASAVVVVFLVAETIAYLSTSAPSMADAEGWLRLFRSNRLVALIDFGVLELCILVLFVPMFLALYKRLRPASPMLTALAGLLAVAGIAANFGSNPLFPMLTLSDAYSAAAGEAARAQLVAVAQAMLAAAALGGIGGSVQGGFPLAVAGLLLSVVMLRSRLLGTGPAYAGLLANAMALAMYTWGAVAPTLGGSPFFAPFLLLSVIWYALLARGLWRLQAAEASARPEPR